MITPLTPSETADYLRCSLSSIEKLKRTGQLEGTYYYVGRRLLFMPDKLDEWMKKGGTQ